MVSVSPRLPNLDSDEEVEAANTDPRFRLGFRSLSIDSAGYSDHELADDHRLFGSIVDAKANRRRQRQRQNDELLQRAEPFEYLTDADGDAFRLVVLQPGTGASPIHCNLAWECSKDPKRNYSCLSYAWASDESEDAKRRDIAIMCDGYCFAVTKNLLHAMRSLRKPKQTVLIWIDQICINQNNDRERGHQVSIMKHIFKKASKVYVWLGEADERSERLFAYAKSMRRGSDENTKTKLNRILSQRELRDAIQNLLGRAYFQRVWVVPEAALATRTTVACGRAHITWPEMVRLVRDVKMPQHPGFDKTLSLPGNSRQRIAIINQMIASQKEGLAHTDITQLLLLGKGGKASRPHDMVYAFYGLTLLTTFPDYSIPITRLYTDIAEHYINSILYEFSYETWHKLTEQQKAFQLMSIVYSAGSLHHHTEMRQLPSWVPDWTFRWHLAPVWCKSDPNFLPTAGKDEWSSGIRSDFRSGGDRLETFELIGDRQLLRLSALIIDTIVLVNEITPVPTPDTSQVISTSPTNVFEDPDTPTLKYGRHFFATAKGHIGLGTPGIQEGDLVAVLLGGDVPVVIRLAIDELGSKEIWYILLCECYLQSPTIMHGDYVRANWTNAEDILIT